MASAKKKSTKKSTKAAPPKKKATAPKRAMAKKQTTAKAKPKAKKKSAPKQKAAAKQDAAVTTKKKKPAAPPTGIVPTAVEEARFWSLLEDAWATQSAEVNAARLALATREPGSEADTELVDGALDAVIESLRAVFAFDDFPQDELVAMDRVLERKLHDIDREEIQAVTDGSDDGFLYARGYVVALGKAFFDAVNANPEMAICDAEWEEMCYLPAHIHQDRFGEFPETGSNISRETCSNPAGWPGMNSD